MNFIERKEDMIRELQQLKKMINQTIILIDNADTEMELLRAIIDSPMAKEIDRRI